MLKNVLLVILFLIKPIALLSAELTPEVLLAAQEAAKNPEVISAIVSTVAFKEWVKKLDNQNLENLANLSILQIEQNRATEIVAQALVAEIMDRDPARKEKIVREVQREQKRELSKSMDKIVTHFNEGVLEPALAAYAVAVREIAKVGTEGEAKICEERYIELVKQIGRSFQPYRGDKK
jgi:hypothetical protein